MEILVIMALFVAGCYASYRVGECGRHDDNNDLDGLIQSMAEAIDRHEELLKAHINGDCDKCNQGKNKG